MTPNDTYGIVPRGATVARVKPFEFQIRTLAEYDVNFLSDHIRSDIFVNGKPAGIYACTRVDDRQFPGDKDSLERAMDAYGPELERMVVDGFMGLGYREKVRDLEDRVTKLHAFINRDRWWHFRPVRNAWGRVVAEVNTARRQFAAVIAPGERDVDTD